jgi:hypothetical protein
LRGRERLAGCYLSNQPNGDDQQQPEGRRDASHDIFSALNDVTCVMRALQLLSASAAGSRN